MIKSIYNTILFSFATLLLCACGNSGAKKSIALDSKLVVDTMQVNYAKGFKVVKYNRFSLVEICDPSEESKKIYKYALLPHNMDADSLPEGYEPIRVPIKKVICMTTLQLSGFIKLNEIDRIVGITSTKFVQDSNIKQRLADGAIKRIGIEGEFDTEVVMSIAPDVIFTSPFKRGGFDSIEELDIATFNYLGYKEPSPLGQAEWIKLIGLMLSKEEQAQSIFNGIEKRYLDLQAKADKTTARPTVLSGELHSGNWYVVGGKSYLAELFNDAGADYFMKNDRKTGGFYVDYEKVYAEGYNADYWRIVNSYNGTFSYDALGKADSRYSDLKAFRKRGVIYCNLRERPFYERTPMEPDVVLADLIKIFHPSLLPDHSPVYYSLLK